jgi:catechol 2,3-dioxygenase-like lactoylglutathione lyase family enzyme
VADYDSALAWYERLLGRAPDVVVSDNEAMWQLRDGGWVYVVGDAARAGRGLLTVLVDDLDDLLEQIAARGLGRAAIESAAGLYRKATLEDPDGNTISFGEDLSGR